MSTNTPQKFWMVKGNGPTSAHHHSRPYAEAEAARLARMYPDQTLYVLEAVAAHRTTMTERVSLDGLDPDGTEPAF